MRTKIIIGLAVLVIVGVVAVVWLMSAKPRAGPWKLPDGSELSLAGVTYGKNHAMRYGNGVVDYLYPVLTSALRAKWGCKVATMTAGNMNGIVIWIWQKGVSPMTAATALPAHSPNLTAVDENGFESEMPMYPNSRVTWHKTNVLLGFMLDWYPRRSSVIGFRLHEFGDTTVLGEFKIANRTRTNYPAWVAAPLPVTLRSNDAEISLVTFEAKADKKRGASSSRVVFNFKREGTTCNDWIMQTMWVRSGAGEHYDFPFWQVTTYGTSGKAEAISTVPLWPEEPAWRVTAQFWRTTNYPADELWTVRGVAIPADGVTKDLNVTTNLSGSEIELIGITGVYGPAVLHVTSPIPSLDKHLRLAAVTDDRGRKVDFHLDHETPSTGGRGATVRQLDKDYFIYPEEDAKSVEVTLAYSKVVTVEFLAKPTWVK